MGMMALGALLAWAGPAGAVTDQNTTDLGQMAPFADTLYPIVHMTAMQQDNTPFPMGPRERTVTGFAEDLAKSLPLIPGAPMAIGCSTMLDGRIACPTGRGIGFSHLTIHDPLTGTIDWQTPRYLGPLDYPTQRTIGPYVWIGMAITDEDNNLFIDDGWNAWSFEPDGAVRWVRSHSELPPGWQRINQEPLRQQNMNNDYIYTGTFAPEAIRAPSGEHLYGGVYTRGNLVLWDSATGDPVIVKSMRLPGQPAEGIELPLLYALIDLVCFPGGQIALEAKDTCTSTIFTRFLSVNTTTQDPLRNQFYFTYGGDGENFDYMKAWAYVTENGVGQPGTILTDDTDGDGFGDAGAEQVWEAEYGVNSGATPTLLPSMAAISGADGFGVAYIFDPDDGTILTSGTGAGAGFSTASDFDDQQAACNAGLGILKISSADASVIWNQAMPDLGIEVLPVIPDAPLVATGRPGQACAGATFVARDYLSGQFPTGYPFRLFEALAGLGAPITTGTLLPVAVVDVLAGYETGSRDEAQFHSIYSGSGEAGMMPTGQGNYISYSVDAIAAIASGVFNIILPRRYDVDPPTAGFKLSEPVSYRENLKQIFVVTELFCEDVRAALPSPCTEVDGSCTPNDERLLQLAVNKARRIAALVNQAVGPYSDRAQERSPSELNDFGRTAIENLAAGIEASAATARDLLLGNQPGNPSAAAQAAAEDAMDDVCARSRVAQLLLSLPALPPPAPEPPIAEGDPHCYAEYDLAGTFQIADTPGNLGTGTFGPLDGKMILKYTDDGAGNIVVGDDAQTGRVEMMWVWVHQDFVVPGSPTVTTNVQNFSPSCNGEQLPFGWGVDGIPQDCTYVGDLETQNPVSVGELVLDEEGNQVIKWQNCDADPGAYWADLADSNNLWTTSAAMASSGRGCIALKAGRTADTGGDEIVPDGVWHSFGNVNCDGSKVTCGPGGLEVGDNVQQIGWPQSLQHGQSGGPGTVNQTNVNPDGSIMFPGTNPAAGNADNSIQDGHQSVQIPNDQPSNTFLGAMGSLCTGDCTALPEGARACNPPAP